ENLVGQIEHETALVVRPRQAQRHRLELKHEVVAKGAVKPEVLILGTAEEVDQTAQNREHRGLAAAPLLRKALRSLLDGARYSVAPSPFDASWGKAGERLCNRVQQ